MSKTCIIMVYGGLGGLLVILCMGIAMASGVMSNSSLGEAFGYLSMLIALSMVFVGIKRYRDEELGGVIRFGTALSLGLGISMLASVLYVLGWEMYLYATDYSFAGEWVAALLEDQRAAGASPAELAASRAEMDGFIAMYSNPLYRLPITFSEIAPVALAVTVISAALLSNSRVWPASRTA